MATGTDFPATVESGLAIGAVVRITRDVARFYRKGGAPSEGVLLEVSPRGGIARVRADELADTYVLTQHLEVIRETL